MINNNLLSLLSPCKIEFGVETSFCYRKIGHNFIFIFLSSKAYYDIGSIY